MKVVLDDLLKSKGKTQYWLAKETGIMVSTISKLRNNKTTKIDFAVLDKICEALGCDVSDVLIPDHIYKHIQKHFDIINSQDTKNG